MSTTLIIVASAAPASVFGALAMLVPALRIRRRADNDLIEAGVAMGKAEELLTEYERNRNKPWYWPTGPAIEAAPAEHEGEVLHVEHPTQEMRLVDGLARLADEVGLVQALGCCTAHGDEPCAQDSGLVPPYCCDDCPDLTPEPEPLALSDRSHADGQADHTDTDRRGMWRVLLGLASDLVDRAHDWLPNLLAQWRERNDSGWDGPSDNEPWTLYDEDQLRAQGVSEEELKMLRDGNASVPYDEATDAEARLLEVEAYRTAKGNGIGEVLAASGYELDIADEDELDEQRAEWVALNPPTLGPDGQRHWNNVTAMHNILTPGRHRKMPINIPAQRTGEVEA
jgi:hypothetical protein